MSPPIARRTVASGARRGGVGRALCVTRVGDDDGRFAVVDDVARFLAGEVPVDRREAVTTATGRRPHLGKLGTVATHEREPGAGLGPPTPERTDELVGSRVELAERAVPVLADDRDPVGHLARPIADHRAAGQMNQARIRLSSRRRVAHHTPLARRVPAASHATATSIPVSGARRPYDPASPVSTGGPSVLLHPARVERNEWLH